MTGKQSFIVRLLVCVLSGLLKGILKGSYDVQKEAAIEWNKEQVERFQNSFKK